MSFNLEDCRVSSLRTTPAESLTEAAKAELVERGFEPDFPEAVVAEARAAASTPFAGRAAGTKDLRDLLWSSIDNAESRDLDQIEYAEKQSDGSIRLCVGIADVDAFAPKDSALDRHAAINTTT